MTAATGVIVEFSYNNRWPERDITADVSTVASSRGAARGMAARGAELTAHEKAPLCGAFSTRPRGFEPLTFGSVDRRSIQLSYGRSCVSEHSDRAVMVALRDASGEGGIRTRDGT